MDSSSSSDSSSSQANHEASATAHQTRSVGTFDRINCDALANLTVDAGASTTSVVLDGPAGILPKIKTEVQDGTLVISEDHAGFTFSSSTPSITIGVPALSGVNVSGAGRLGVTKIHASDFALDVSGASNAKLAGTAGTLATTISGAGSLDSVALKARTVTVTISGTAKAKVWASESLTASVAGVGSVEYFGNPAHVKQSIAGIGSIEPAK
jgi:hypothetical protein